MAKKIKCCLVQGDYIHVKQGDVKVAVAIRAGGSYADVILGIKKIKQLERDLKRARKELTHG